MIRKGKFESVCAKVRFRFFSEILLVNSNIEAWVKDFFEIGQNKDHFMEP